MLVELIYHLVKYYVDPWKKRDALTVNQDNSRMPQLYRELHKTAFQMGHPF